MDEWRKPSGIGNRLLACRILLSYGALEPWVREETDARPVGYRSAWNRLQLPKRTTAIETARVNER